MAEYDIFIDESGLFIETSTEPADQVKHHRQRRIFPSQLAGIICPARRLTEASARRIIERSLKSAEIIADEQFHCNRFKQRSKPAFDRFICLLVDELAEATIQAARIVNEEGVSYGDRAANYTNILAEFLVRICRELSVDANERVSLNVFAAKVRGDEDEEGVFEILDRGEYVARVQEYFARAAVANGWSGASAKWRINRFQLLSGKDDPRIWVADAISNSSHDNYSTIGDGAGASLRAAMNGFDWTLSFDQTLRSVDELAHREAYGQAIISLTERTISDATSDEAVIAYQSQMRRIASCLMTTSPSVKLPQLAVVVGWLQQLVECRSDLHRAIKIGKWLETELCDIDAANVDPSLAQWLRLVIATWMLTACNHDGDTTAARAYANRIDTLLPAVAGRWEYVADLMQAIVSKAVHLNDCFEHDAALCDLRKVVKYYRDLGEWFSESYPGLFPETIRSDQCGKALGTQLQSEIFLLLAGKGNAKDARRTSKSAFAEFMLEDDRCRQHQYRSELEAVVGEWEAARKSLATSLGISDNSHVAIANSIHELGNAFAQGFAMLHWTRIGGLAAMADAASELDGFLVALKRAKLEHIGWVQGKCQHYPSHGILRRLATVYAAKHDVPMTGQCLSRLESVVDAKPRPVFRMIQIAAFLQCADLLSAYDEAESRTLIFGAKKKTGALEHIRSLRTKTESDLPRLAVILRGWEERIATFTDAGPTNSAFGAMAAIVGY